MTYLVGGFEPYPSEKYEFVSWGYYSQYMEKWFKPCSKPPTRNVYPRVLFDVKTHWSP